MKIFNPILLLAAAMMFSSSFINAQIDGDNIFGQDQVINIELTFPQNDFWTELTANYDADENEYIPAQLVLTDLTGTYTFDSIGVRLKGNSSYSHPGNKKSFKIDFNKFITAQNYDGLKKINFSNGFKDPSLIREKIFFDVCREADVPAPRASFANVTMNGTAWGFYTVIEQIDDQFLDWKIGDDDGNLFKAGDNFGGGGGPGGGGGGEAADLVYYGDQQSEYEEKYELKSNEIVNNWTDLIELIDFLNNSTDQDFEIALENYIELDDFLRSAALDMLFSNLDTYTGSARNYYIYHNLSTNKWEWIKWDANEAFGSYTNGAGNMTTLALNYHDNDRPLLDRIFDSSILYNQYLEEVCFLTENFFNSDYIDARADVIKALVQEHVYADDNKMYSNANFDTNVESDITGGGGGPGGGTTYGIKSFVAARSAYIDGLTNCVLSSIEDFEIVKLQAFPNPSQGMFEVRWSDQIDISNIQIIDGQGKSVAFNHTLFDGGLEISTSAEKGIYLLQIIHDKGMQTVPIILQ